MNRLGRIFDNLMDLIQIGGKLGVEYIVDVVNSLSWIWKEDHLTPPIDDEMTMEHQMWNGGGVSNKTTSETSDTPYDESNIIYDGVYEDGKINE